MTRTLGVVSVAAIALLTLSACSGGGESSSETAATAEATPAPAPAAPADPAASGVDTAMTDAAAMAEGATPAPNATADASAAEMSAPASPATAAAAAGGGSVVLAGLTGDATAGARVFNQCKTCHVLEQGVNKVGPSLYGIVGRKAGTIPGFRYSPANKNSGITWTEQQIFTYLENPRKMIPGTYMSFVGLKQPQQRADVIAYLKTAS